MKTPVEADLEATLGALFQRYPALCGFTVQDVPGPEGDLRLADVGVFPWQTQSRTLLGEITVALLDLIDARPEARELIRGRTFARLIH